MKEVPLKPVTLFDTLGFVWSVIRQGRLALFAMLFCGFIFAVIEVVLPAIGKHLFDTLAAAGTPANANMTLVWGIVAAFVGGHFLFWVFRYSMYFLWQRYSAAYMTRAVATCFARVQLFSTSWHNDTFAGVTIRNITRAMSAIDGLLEVCVTQFFPTFVLIVCSAVYLFIMGHPVMGLLLIVFVVLFLFLTGSISLKIVGPLNRTANEADSRIGGLVADAISCDAAIKAYGTQAQEAARLESGLANWRQKKLKAWFASMWNGVLQTTLTFVMRMGLTVFVVYEWSQGRATLGDLFFIMSISAVINAYLRDFGVQLRNLQNHINDLDPVTSYMHTHPAIEDAPDAATLVVGRGHIRFQGVTFGYKDDRAPLFSELDVEIPAGQTVALVGRSGSGKSSFVKLLQRFYNVRSGQILIDGQDIARVTQQSLHAAMALVPQDPVLFHRTLFENIAYGRPDATLDDVRAAARDAFIDDFITGLPEGYNTLVGERGVKLSGGERQRVAIARAILADRPILIMDEATSSLDSLSENLIQKALEKLMHGKTTLVIAHRLSTIRGADTILVFEGGRIVEAGPHDSLLALNGAYKRLFDAQADGFL